MQSDNFVIIQGWMCNELKLKGNDLLVYALIYGFSQDGESEFSGGRKYIANTFNISLPTVDKALKNLVGLNLIEKISTEHNGVLFVTYKVSLGVVKNLYGGSKESLHNIYSNNKDNGISKDIPYDSSEDFLNNFGKQAPKKPNLYQKCLAIIDSNATNTNIRNLMINYLDLCLENNYIRGVNQWKGMIETTLPRALNESDSGITLENIIEKALTSGWKTFYPIHNYNNNNFDVRRDVEMIASNNYDKYDHTKSERSF